MKRLSAILFCFLIIAGTSGCGNSSKKTDVSQPDDNVEVVDNQEECIDDNEVSQDDVECPQLAWKGRVGDDQDVTVWIYHRVSDGLCAGQYIMGNSEYMVLGRRFGENEIQLEVFDNVFGQGVIFGKLTEDGSLTGEWADFKTDNKPVSMTSVPMPENTTFPFRHPAYKNFKAASEYVRVDWDESYWAVNIITDKDPKMAVLVHTPYESQTDFGTIAPDYSSWDGLDYKDGFLTYSYSQNENLVFEFFDQFVEVTIKWVGEGDGYRQAEAVGGGFYILGGHFDDLPVGWFEGEGEEG